MAFTRPLGAIAALLCALTPVSAQAQRDSTDWVTSARFGERFGVLYSTTIGNPTVFSPTKRRPFDMLSLRASWLITGSRENGLEYVVETMPAVVAKTSRDPYDYGRATPDQPASQQGATTFGVGMLPIGVRGFAGVSRSVRLTVETGGGVLLFTSPVPNALSRKFNFTGMAGAGLEVDVGGARTLTAGYRLLHYSNAHSALNNPGVDNSVLYLGLLVRGRH